MIYVYSGEKLFRNYPPDSGHLLGLLPDPLSCVVRRNTEGLFDLSLTYPKTGANADKLQVGRWLQVPVGGTLGNQYFCIVECDGQTAAGEIAVEAVHASYNAQAIVAAPFQSATPSKQASVQQNTTSYYAWYTQLVAALRKVSTSQLGSFTVVGYTDKMTINAARYTEPVTLWDAARGAVEDQEDLMVLSDNFGLKLWQKNYQADPAFEVRYGRDLLDYSSAEKFPESGLYTHIFPYVRYGDDQTETYYDQIFQLNGIPAQYSGVERILPVDFSNLYGLESATSDQGLELTFFKIGIDLYLQEHPFPAFPAEITVEPLPDGRNTFELGLCGDVFFDEKGGYLKAVITSLEYDVLQDRITSIGVGQVHQSLPARVAGLMKRAVSGQFVALR